MCSEFPCTKVINYKCFEMREPEGVGGEAALRADRALVLLLRQVDSSKVNSHTNTSTCASYQ